MAWQPKIWNGTAWDEFVWKTADGSGGFHTRTKLWDGSTWQPFVVPPDVGMNNFTQNNTRVGAACTSKVKIDSDGNVYGTTNTGTYTFNQKWLDAGYNTDVWVSRDRTGDGLDSDNMGGGRNLCNVDYVLGYLETVAGTTSSGTITFTFYDAATGGNVLDTAVVTLSAYYEDLS